MGTETPLRRESCNVWRRYNKPEVKMGPFWLGPHYLPISICSYLYVYNIHIIDIFHQNHFSVFILQLYQVKFLNQTFAREEGKERKKRRPA